MKQQAFPLGPSQAAVVSIDEMHPSMSVLGCGQFVHISSGEALEQLAAAIEVALSEYRAVRSPGEPPNQTSAK